MHTIPATAGGISTAACNGNTGPLAAGEGIEQPKQAVQGLGNG